MRPDRKDFDDKVERAERDEVDGERLFIDHGFCTSKNKDDAMRTPVKDRIATPDRNVVGKSTRFGVDFKEKNPAFLKGINRKPPQPLTGANKRNIEDYLEWSNINTEDVLLSFKNKPIEECHRDFMAGMKGAGIPQHEWSERWTT
jgi:hypothetical protein